MGWKADAECTDKHQSVLSRRLTSRHAETEKLYQEERWKRQWPVGGFRIYWKMVIIGSLVGQMWAMRENSRRTPELWVLVAFAYRKKITEKEFWCNLDQILPGNASFVPAE